jgi:hypothetical protein
MTTETSGDRVLLVSHSPYDHLYIYLIKGLVLHEDESPLGRSFLGNWVEEVIEKERFRKNRWIVLSGLMRSHARDLETDLARYGLQIVKNWEDEATWYTMLVSNGVHE